MFSEAVRAIFDVMLISSSCPLAESVLMSQSLDEIDGNDF